MSKHSVTDIENLLTDWKKTKEELANLEKHLEKLKGIASKIMYIDGTNILKTEKYQLQQRSTTRLSINKQDLPVDLWEKYAKPCTFSTFYLSELKPLIKEAKQKEVKQKEVKKKEAKQKEKSETTRKNNLCI